MILARLFTRIAVAVSAFVVSLTFATTIASAESAELPSRLRRPVALQLSANVDFLFVANRRGGSVSIVDLANKKTVAEFAVGKQLSDLVVTPDQKWLLATDEAAHELVVIEINASQGPNLARPLSSIGRNASTLLWDGWLSSNYHALQVAVNRRLSKGILIKGAYTYSAAINMTDDTGWAGVGWNAQSQISRNRARAGYDIPQNFQLGLVAELPFGKGKSWASEGPAAAVLGGWQLSSIYSAVAGRPFTVGAAGGSVNSPGNPQTPDIIGATSYPRGTGPGDSWFNPNAFRPVEFSPGYNTTTGRRFGTAGRNILRNPGYANIDISVVRNFRLTCQKDFPVLCIH